METETWKSLWTFTFFAASSLFYVVVFIVAIKGAGDVKRMILAMIAARNVELEEREKS